MAPPRGEDRQLGLLLPNLFQIEERNGRIDATTQLAAVAGDPVAQGFTAFHTAKMTRRRRKFPDLDQQSGSASARRVTA